MTCARGWGDASRLASAPGVRVVALTDVAQMVFLVNHGVGATTMVWSRDSVACANSLQRPGAATRHAREQVFIASKETGYPLIEDSGERREVSTRPR